MNTSRVVATIPRREGEELRATLGEYRGQLWVTLRIHFRAECGDWHPKPAFGITIAAHRFHEFENAVIAIRRAIDAERRPNRYERYARERSTA